VIASNVDDEIVKLRDLEHVTSIFVTHQIRDAFYVARHEAVTNGGGNRRSASQPPSARGSWCCTKGGSSSKAAAPSCSPLTNAYLKEFLFMTLPP
jgi:hypothetical protein